MTINADGKFIDRFVAALIPAAIMLVPASILWWADSRSADARFTDQIAILARKVEAVETLAAQDRQRLAELAGDMRSVLRSTSRIESLLDRNLMPPPPPAKP